MINWGILGYARIARLSVIPAILASGNGRVQALASRDAAKLEEARAQLPELTGYASYSELLADPQVDAVYIPLPNACIGNG
jgi:xylose dehydrogenase (NAD/NADP)